MRVDIPHDLPRIPAERRQAPLEPSPIEQRRESLDNSATNRKALTLPRPQRNRERILKNMPDRRRDLPDERRPSRRNLSQPMIGVQLREQDRKLLAEVGRFRVIATRDLASTIYSNHRNSLDQDLRYLRERGLVEVDAVNARRDGRGQPTERIEVVTLTRAGRDLARTTGDLAADQQIYAGMVKPREIEHDAQIYRAYLKEAERIEKEGGQNLRVRLDFELKSEVQKAIYAARKSEPERDLTEIKQHVAAQHELPFVNNTIQIPDARIEYELDQGGRTGHADIEVLTAAYRPGHLRSKAQAGFHAYASSADRASISGKVEDDHGLMQDILEL